MRFASQSRGWEAHIIIFDLVWEDVTQEKLRMKKEGDRIVFPRWKHSGIIKDRSKISQILLTNDKMNIAVGHSVFKARGVRRNGGTAKREQLRLYRFAVSVGVCHVSSASSTIVSSPGRPISERKVDFDQYNRIL